MPVVSDMEIHIIRFSRNRTKHHGREISRDSRSAIYYPSAKKEHLKNPDDTSSIFMSTRKTIAIKERNVFICVVFDFR